ncbi:Protein kinase-like domain [Pseudocohnilembus persalinus]|uniref:Protein kinase-like domain n=1 Tax=Pseudocohnilembus persalinus TaxID=266149 RepID=A0A0V0QRL1_PSEPJ|nr:Protein kinase-like domain [Pseudocohnilembus persalinus]|eukprot:KRX04828.1 Protein kinase-like domain [Pseudocohnilembus persalinus]
MEAQVNYIEDNLIVLQNKVTDDYEIEQHEKYKGVQGEIRFVKSKFNGKQRVLKILKKNVISSQAQELILRNVGLLQNQRNEIKQGLLRVYEFYEDQNFFYMIQQKCEGESLVDHILERAKKEQGKFYTEKLVANLIESILKIIEQGNKIGLIHGNMRLSSFIWGNHDEEQFEKNIMHPYIVDFGISMSMINPNHKYEKIHPTFLPYCISPEYIQALPISENCDSWSIGVLTYLLLCGNLPFNSSQEISIYEEIETGLVDFEYTNSDIWQKISLDAKNFILDCLQPDQTIRKKPQELLQHNWFKQMENLSDNSQILTPLNNTLTNLKTTYLRLQIIEITQHYYLMYKNTLEENEQILRYLRGLDKNKTRDLSINDFQTALSQVLNSVQVHKIIENIQKFDFLDSNNKVYYSLWSNQSYMKQKKKQHLQLIQNLKDIRNNSQNLELIEQNKIYLFRKELKQIMGSKLYHEFEENHFTELLRSGMPLPYLEFEDYLKNYAEQKANKTDELNSALLQQQPLEIPQNTLCSCTLI